MNIKVKKYSCKRPVNVIEYASTIKHISNIPLDVHFMVEDVKENIEKYIPLSPSIITFHYEACKSDEEVIELINYIKENFL